MFLSLNLTFTHRKSYFPAFYTIQMLTSPQPELGTLLLRSTARQIVVVFTHGPTDDENVQHVIGRLHDQKQATC